MFCGYVMSELILVWQSDACCRDVADECEQILVPSCSVRRAARRVMSSAIDLWHVMSSGAMIIGKILSFSSFTHHACILSLVLGLFSSRCFVGILKVVLFASSPCW